MEEGKEAMGIKEREEGARQWRNKEERRSQGNGDGDGEDYQGKSTSMEER